MAAGKYNRELNAAKLIQEDYEDALESEEKEDVNLAYERLCDAIKKLETSKDNTTEALLSEEKPLEEVREWNKKQKEEMKSLREMRTALKQQMEKFNEREFRQKQERELELQRWILAEQAKVNREKEKEREEASIRQQQREEEWYQKKFELDLELTRKKEASKTVNSEASKIHHNAVQRRIQRLAEILEPVHSGS